jgi:hypothetical protein
MRLPLLGLVVATVAAIAGPAGAAAPRDVFFRSPSGNIGCEVNARRPGVPARAYCQTRVPQRSVTLDGAGRLSVARAIGDAGDQRIVTLAYGRSLVVGPFRCTSTVAGMRCLHRADGRGFVISRAGVRRLPYPAGAATDGGSGRGCRGS